uniref:EF-hand domain-containing protein n=1 Tax=Magallana gigas TaxID=29159 RepID=K1QR37_MAGGI
MEISQPRNAFRELFFKHASEDGKLEAKELKEFISELSRTASTLDFPVNRRIEMAIVRRYTDRDDKIRLQDFIIIICKLTLMHREC